MASLGQAPLKRWQITAIKMTMLCFSCLLGFGSYFCYDSPAALQSEIKSAMNLTQSEFMSLYAWYSWPNVFLCFVGGYLIDAVLGRRLGGICFATFVLIGQASLAMGMRKKSLLFMDIGRLIFGLGGETLAVVGNAYSVAWFSGSMLNLAFGAVLSVSRLGSTASLNALEPLYEYLKKKAPENMADNIILSNVLGIAALACAASLCVALILSLFDYKLHKRVKVGEEILNAIDDGDDAPLINSDVSQDNSLADEAESVDEDRETQLPFTDESHLLATGEGETTTIETSPGFLNKLISQMSFSPGTWLIFAICVFFYSSVFPLISQGVEFFEKWFHVDAAEARLLNSVVYTMSLPASPFFGVVVDRTRRNTGWVMAAILITGSAHGLMACAHYFTFSPWIPVCMIGLGYSMLACSLWPMVSYLVPEEKLGTAYGLMQAIQNLGLALTAMLSGVIVDRGGYLQMLLFYLTFQGLAFVCCLVLWVKHGVNVDKNLPSVMGNSGRSR